MSLAGGGKKWSGEFANFRSERTGKSFFPFPSFFSRGPSGKKILAEVLPPLLRHDTSALFLPPRRGVFPAVLFLFRESFRAFFRRRRGLPGNARECMEKGFTVEGRGKSLFFTPYFYPFFPFPRSPPLPDLPPLSVNTLYWINTLSPPPLLRTPIATFLSLFFWGSCVAVTPPRPSLLFSLTHPIFASPQISERERKEEEKVASVEKKREKRQTVNIQDGKTSHESALFQETCGIYG